MFCIQDFPLLLNLAFGRLCKLVTVPVLAHISTKWKVVLVNSLVVLSSRNVWKGFLLFPFDVAKISAIFLLEIIFFEKDRESKLYQQKKDLKLPIQQFHSSSDGKFEFNAKQNSQYVQGVFLSTMVCFAELVHSGMFRVDFEVYWLCIGGNFA